MIGATREGRVAPVFAPRDHYTTRGRAKRPLTQEAAQALCDAYNAGTVKMRYRIGKLVAYRCRVCDEYHTGHLREECPIVPTPD
jgi:rubrerythrin